MHRPVPRPRDRSRGRTHKVVTTAAAALAVLLAACGPSAGLDPPAAASGQGARPVTVGNCGAEVTFEAPPERVVLLKSAAVPFLHALGVLDRVAARAGQYPAEYYDDRTLAELAEIPVLTDELDSSGHLLISSEVVIGLQPDLVLGEVDNLSRDTLAAVGIPLLEEPALCAGGVAAPGFDDVTSQLATYGRVFGREEQAASAAAELAERVEQVRARAARTGAGRSAAVLYPTVGGGTTYAYGTRSMAHPQLEAAGFENVFADVDERVFEVSLEELLGRDPDVLVLLHSEGAPSQVEEALTSLPGAEDLTAVRTGQVMTQLFNFTEPPTPLSVDGLERIAERFRGTR